MSDINKIAEAQKKLDRAKTALEKAQETLLAAEEEAEAEAKAKAKRILEADLIGADLSGADLTGADLTGAILDNVIIRKGWKLVRDE